MRIVVLASALSLVTLIACSLTTGSGGGGGNESCTAGAACGSGSVQICVTQDSKGDCTGVNYKTGSQSFGCNSCSDCTSAASSALAACEGGGGSGSGSSGGGSTSSSGSGVNTVCTNGATCTGGSVMKVCTSSEAGGTCTAIAYTVGSQTFTCTGCTNCEQAQSEASQACAESTASSSSGGSGSGSGSSTSSGGSGSGSGSSSGSSSGGTVLTYDGTTGKACTTSTDCHSSTGPGTNVCSNSNYFQEGPVYPQPICLMPGSCNSGTDGNLHYCDGPDAPSSPGVCLATGTTGTGICLPRCNFAPGGNQATGCVGKDACYAAGYSADTNGTVLGTGYCFGGCTVNTDCPTGSSCQVNMGTCVTTLTAITAAETSCNSTTVTGDACNCLASTTTDLGFCASNCVVGGEGCPTGWKCEAELPATLVDASGVTVTAWTTQNQGLGGTCVPSCVLDGGTVCPTNSTCQSDFAAGADCLP